MTLHQLDKKSIVYVMLGIMLGVLLAALDSSIVGTAMPTIIKDLSGMEHYNWPFTASQTRIKVPFSEAVANLEASHERERHANEELCARMIGRCGRSLLSHN